MKNLFNLVLSLSMYGTIMCFIVFAINMAVKDKFSKRWSYYVWLIVLFRLLVPIFPEITLYSSLLPAKTEARVAEITRELPEGMNIEKIPADTEYNAMPYEEIRRDESPRTENVATNAEPNLVPKKSSINFSKLLKSSLPMLWLSGAIIFLIYKLIAYFKFKKTLLEHSIAVSDHRIIDIFNELYFSMNCIGDVKLLKSDFITTPMIVGTLKPYIIIPNKKFSDAELNYLLSHELIHFKHYDLCYKWFTQAVLCIHWFNPIVHFLAYQIDLDCELACDEMLVRNADTDDKKCYGELLLSIAINDRAIKHPLVGTMSNEGKFLKRRLKNIMKSSKTSRITKLISSILLCVLLSFSVLIGCNLSVKEKDTLPAVVDETHASDYDLASFNDNKIILNSSDYEELYVTDSEILTKPYLNATMVKDGVIYGTGYGPTGDGTKRYAQYSFDFAGNVSEKIDEEKSIWLLPIDKMDEKNGKYYYWDDVAKNIFEVDYKAFSERNLELTTDAKSPLGIILVAVNGDDYYYFDGVYPEKNELYKMNFKTKEHERLKVNDDFDEMIIYNSSNLKIIDNNIYFVDGENKNPDDSCNLYEYDTASDKLSKIITFSQDDYYLSSLNRSANFLMIPKTDGLVIWNSETKTIETEIAFNNSMKFTNLNPRCKILIKDGAPNEFYILNFPGESHINIYDIRNKQLYELKLKDFSLDDDYLKILHIDESYLYLQSMFKNWDIAEGRADKFYRIDLDKIFNNKNLITDDDLFYDEASVDIIGTGTGGLKGNEIGASFGKIDYADEDMIVFHTHFGIFVYDIATANTPYSNPRYSFAPETFGLDSFTLQGEHRISVQVLKEARDNFQYRIFIRNSENETAYEFRESSGLVKRSYANELAKSSRIDLSTNYSTIETSELPGIEKYQDLNKDETAVKIDDDNYVFLATQNYYGYQTLELGFYNTKTEELKTKYALHSSHINYDMLSFDGIHIGDDLKKIEYHMGRASDESVKYTDGSVLYKYFDVDGKDVFFSVNVPSSHNNGLYQIKVFNGIFDGIEKLKGYDGTKRGLIKALSYNNPNNTIERKDLEDPLPNTVERLVYYWPINGNISISFDIDKDGKVIGSTIFWGLEDRPTAPPFANQDDNE